MIIPISEVPEGCICIHPKGAHYAAFGCFYCECPYVPPTEEEMTYTNHGFLTEKIRENGDIEITCFCGAVWVHSKNKASFEEKKSIMASHIKYFDKVQHTVL